MRARTLTTAQRSDSEKEMQTSCGEWEASERGRKQAKASEEPSKASEPNFKRQMVSGSSDEKSSYKERRVDAKAPYADEGRGQLRKASGSCKQA